MADPSRKLPLDERPERSIGDEMPPVDWHHDLGEEELDQRFSTVSSEGQSYGALVWRRLRRSIPGVLGLVLVALLLIVALFAPFFAPVDPKAPNVAFAPPDGLSWHVPGEGPEAGWHLMPVSFPLTEGAEYDPITFQPILSPDYENPRQLVFFAKGWEYSLFGIEMSRHFIGTEGGTPLHLLGTDKLGRDILSRGIVGSRISLAIALTSVALITVIGTLAGITSGYIGGTFDLWFQRFVEVVLAFPQLPLYLALATLIPVTAPSGLFLTFVVLVIVGLGWAQLSREVRSKTLSLRRVDYVRAAQAVGAGDGRIITRHILPNVLSHVIVSITLGIPTIVLLESFLGFLGFAVKPPLISWGLMLQDAGTFSVIGSYPWILSPVGFVLITVFAFNALGDGLRDAVDPY
ncbi:ABC transporter permease [Pseudoroseicyclus aestuarii]|uniref:Peptide/nickel transport system permease protein n=1 Tax=Pseudoroseicyclus aestuarii TaxID=1795041 RepID=A0A318SSZ1_9RHOB|nr:ABC transporter permease [Pseudoroseicyclus aestuarii]PYE82422.1 peptide/nickel transport system permease protein [Pseudoroseicyclus aestuarii]